MLDFFLLPWLSTQGRSLLSVIGMVRCTPSLSVPCVLGFKILQCFRGRVAKQWLRCWRRSRPRCSPSVSYRWMLTRSPQPLHKVTRSFPCDPSPLFSHQRAPRALGWGFWSGLSEKHSNNQTLAKYPRRARTASRRELWAGPGFAVSRTTPERVDWRAESPYREKYDVLYFRAPKESCLCLPRQTAVYPPCMFLWHVFSFDLLES